jgi:hypothetical protein
VLSDDDVVEKWNGTLEQLGLGAVAGNAMFFWMTVFSASITVTNPPILVELVCWLAT